MSNEFDYNHALRLEALRLAVQARPDSGEEVQMAEAFHTFLTADDESADK